jgi:hypothetical protein
MNQTFGPDQTDPSNAIFMPRKAGAGRIWPTDLPGNGSRAAGRRRRKRLHVPAADRSGASGRTVQSSDLSTTRWCARLANLRTAPAIRLRPASVLSRVSRRAADRHRAGDRSRGKAQAWRRSRGSLESASSGAGAQLIPGTSALPQQRQSSLAWTAMDCCFLSRLDGAKRVGEQFCSDAEGTERPAER